LALQLVATVGAANANAYATVIEASAALAYRVGGSVWEDEDDDAKIQDLVTARVDLDTLPLYGTRESDSQSLEFPREGTDANGDDLPSGEIPAAWKQANIELAFFYAQRRLALPAAQQTSVEVLNNAPNNRKRVKSGEDEVEFFAPSDEEAYTLLSHFPAIVQRLVARFVFADVPALWGSATVTRTS
jgi:hypothetical protein